jgi:hypothetical protein
MAIDPQISTAWLAFFPTDFLRWLQDNLENLRGITLRGTFVNPNGNVVGNPGDLYSYNNDGAATLWFKTAGVSTNTNWTQVTIP